MEIHHYKESSMIV